MSSDYLKFAKNKFNQSKSVDFSISFRDFVCDCYVRLNPCSYGKRIEQKIVRELGLTPIKANENRGDSKINGEHYEIKVSFLSNLSNAYNVTHLRPWQLINYYLFCLIDCENDFTPMFFVLPKHIVRKLKTNPMNGTESSNENNHNVELRSTIVKGSKEYGYLVKYNLLEDTSINSMKKYLLLKGL
jgi:hypothetical protein